MNKKKYPYLAYSQLTNCVYIVISKDEKIDVTNDFELIVDWRKIVRSVDMSSKRLIWKDEFGDTHSTNKKINGKFVGDKDVRAKLYEYEQAESEGRLIRLPCKIGDNIYKIGEFINGIKILSVNHFEVNEDCVAVYSDPWDGMICEAHQVGKVVKEQFDWNGYFLTKEEAEQALKEREKNE